MKKRKKEIVTISFDRDVVKALKKSCRSDCVSVSKFVNSVVSKMVLSEFEFCRNRAKFHAGEMAKWRTLMDTAADNPNPAVVVVKR